MGVVEARHHRALACVDHLRLGRLQGLDLGVRAHAQDLVAGDRDRLGHGPAVARVDRAVHDDEIGGHRRLAGRAGHGDRNGKADDQGRKGSGERGVFQGFLHGRRRQPHTRQSIAGGWRPALLTGRSRNVRWISRRRPLPRRHEEQGHDRVLPPTVAVRGPDVTSPAPSQVSMMTMPGPNDRAYSRKERGTGGGAGGEAGELIAPHSAPLRLREATNLGLRGCIDLDTPGGWTIAEENDTIVAGGSSTMSAIPSHVTRPTGSTIRPAIQNVGFRTGSHRT